MSVYLSVCLSVCYRRGLCQKAEHNRLKVIAVNGNSISQLQGVTCHIGSHSVTFHPAQVNTSQPAKPVLD